MIERAIFLTARGLESLPERLAYLDRVCAGDPDLRRRIEEMLETQPDSEPAGEPATPALPLEGPGAWVGRYELAEMRGEGGVGIVYRAVEVPPVQRTVAVKVFKPRLEGSHITARFEVERQALVALQHDHLARVHQVGATESERLYVASDLVEGIPITDYCRDKRLSVRQRLALFVPLCHAIQQAHHKGIIHRNIKPSNVLVTVQDGKPIARILDFGLVGALDSPALDQILLAQWCQGQGRLDYLSPEQAETGVRDIDTRTDVYALGVLLYELLTDSPPLDRQRLGRMSVAQVLACIRTEEPPAPSVQVRDLRGRLDIIVLKALARESSRRYQTASALAEDLERYLCGQSSADADEPLGLRQHRPRLVAVTVLLVAVSLLWLWQVRRGRRIEQAARNENEQAWAAEKKALHESQHLRQQLEQAQKERNWAQTEKARDAGQREQARAEYERIRKEAHRAWTEAATKQAVMDFLRSDLLTHSSPLEPLDADVKLRVLLDRAGGRIAGKLEGQPLVEAALRDLLGVTYCALGLYPEARFQLERGLAIYCSQLGENSLQALWARTDLIQLDLAQGQTERAEAATLDVLREARSRLGPDHPLTLAAMTTLAELYEKQGKLTDAETLVNRVLESCRRTRGPESPEALTCQQRLASLYAAQHKQSEAEETLSRVVQTRSRILGVDHPQTLTTLNNLALLYQKAGKHAQAEKTWSRLLDRAHHALGTDNLATLMVMHNLACNYLQQNKLDRAEKLLSRVVERGRRVLGLDHPRLFASVIALAQLYQSRQQLDKAEALLLSGHESLKKHARAGWHDSKERLEQIRKQLVQVYEAWGKKDHAAIWRKKSSPSDTTEPAEASEALPPPAPSADPPEPLPPLDP